VKTRMGMLLPLAAFLAVLSVVNVAGAQQSGTADEAKALLARAATAVKTDKAGALAKFDALNGGFRDRDLYVFCFDRSAGTVLAGQPATKGKDVRTYVDSTGKRFGQEMFANVRGGDITIVDYMFPRPNSIVPVAKQSFIEGLGDIACGVGYYNSSAQAPEEEARMGREQHACAIVMGLHQPGDLYLACIRSLDKTLSGLEQARQALALRNTCARAGLRPGTPSFAACLETGPGF
jgi:signal transduction histidine kinase